MCISHHEVILSIYKKAILEEGLSDISTLDRGNIRGSFSLPGFRVSSENLFPSGYKKLCPTRSRFEKRM